MIRVGAPLLAGALSASGALAGCSIGGSERVGGEPAADTLVLTMLDPIGNPLELVDFVDEVSRLSDDAVRIRVVTAGHDGADYEAATIRDVQDGRADLAFAGSRAWDEFGAPLGDRDGGWRGDPNQDRWTRRPRPQRRPGVRGLPPCGRTVGPAGQGGPG